MADEIVIGKIGLTPKGDYVPGEFYDILDMVSHEGNSYVSKIQNNEVDVTNTEAWLLAAEKGEDGLSIKGDKGDTFTFNDLTSEQKEELKGDVIAYNSLDEADKNDLASRVPIIGVIEEGNEQAVSGGEVYDAIPKINISSLINENSEYIKYDTVIATNGNAGTNAVNYKGAVAIVDFPLEPNTTYTLGGFNSDASKNFALTDVSGNIDQLSNLAVLPKTFTTTSTHFYLRFSVKHRDASEPTSNWKSNLMLVEGTVLPSGNEVKEINNRKLEAIKLSEGNSVPTPISDLNAVNKAYFDSNALKQSDIELGSTNNLANPSLIQFDKYITNAGSVTNGVGWAMIVIPVDGYIGQEITFGRFTINTAGYSAFRNASGLVENLGAHGILPKTVTVPVGATHLYIDIKRPIDDGSNYAQLTINLGDTLLPYESPILKVEKLAGYEISGNGGSGESYDQSLNTTDEVHFAKVTAPIETSVLVLNLPTSNAGLPVGRAWVDVSNGNVVKVV